MKPIPDSEIARQAEKLLRGTCEPFPVNHCLRSYLWGAALAEAEKVDFDADRAGDCAPCRARRHP